MIPWTVARQAPLSMGILQARIMEWVAMPSSSGDLPNPGIKHLSPAMQADSLPSEPPGKPQGLQRFYVKIASSCLAIWQGSDCHPLRFRKSWLSNHTTWVGVRRGLNPGVRVSLSQEWVECWVRGQLTSDSARLTWLTLWWWRLPATTAWRCSKWWVKQTSRQFRMDEAGSPGGREKPCHLLSHYFGSSRVLSMNFTWTFW